MTAPIQPGTAQPDTARSAGASAALSHKQILTVLSGLMLGMFLASLDQTIVSTAMRTIADRLHGQTAQAWVTTAYLITSTISTPLYGKLSDLYGRKPFYLFAIGIFVVGSLLCGTATSIYQLAAYRAVQGIGAGGLLSLAFTIIGDIVPPRERGRYQAYFMSVFASSSVLGPVLGGALAGQSTIFGLDGWRWIFVVNVPIGIVAFVVVMRVLQLTKTRQQHRIDYLGAGLLSSSIVPILLVAEKGREWGWTSGLTLGLTAVSLVSVVWFVFWERRMAEDAILPLRIFANPVFSITSATSLLLGMGMFGGLVTLPLYLQIVHQQSPTRAGLLLIPLMAGIMSASMTCGKIMRRTGRYRLFPIIGTATMFTGLILLSRLTYESPVWHVEVFMVVMGAGLGMSMQTLIISAQNSLPPKDMGVATGSVTFFRSLGGTFGAAISLAVLFSTVLVNIKGRLVTAGVPASIIDRLVTTSTIDDTSRFGMLPKTYRTAVLQGFADSTHTTFLVTACLMVPAFVCALFIKEVPLREHGGIDAARDEAVEVERAKVDSAVL